jgi:hypothetical protein
MKLSNEDTNAVSDVLKYMAMRDVDSDIGLVRYMRTASPKGIQNVNFVLKAQRKIDLDYRLNSMRRVGKPTSMKELAVNGRDMAKAGFRGREIGDALTYLLDYAVENGKNDKDHLLSIAKGKYGKS